jgi:hypothetical protein
MLLLLIQAVFLVSAKYSLLLQKILSNTSCLTETEKGIIVGGTIYLPLWTSGIASLKCLIKMPFRTE